MEQKKRFSGQKELIEKHKGKWLAIFNHAVIAAAPTEQGILAWLRQQKISGAYVTLAGSDASVPVEIGEVIGNIGQSGDSTHFPVLITDGASGGVTLQMKLDTGAQMTNVPRKFLEDNLGFKKAICESDVLISCNGIEATADALWWQSYA